MLEIEIKARADLDALRKKLKQEGKTGCIELARAARTQRQLATFHMERPGRDAMTDRVPNGIEFAQRAFRRDIQ